MFLILVIFKTYRPGNRKYRHQKYYSPTEYRYFQGKKLWSQNDYLLIDKSHTNYIGQVYKFECISNIINPERNSWKEDQLVTSGELPVY